MDYKSFCFCTLATGLEYRMAAWLLSKDIEMIIPDTRLLVLTDDTLFFNDCQNVIAVYFVSDSPFGCYHDKRFAISQSLLRFDYTCYIDSDCRLISHPNFDLQTFDLGIYAWNVMQMIPRFEMEQKGEKYKSKRGLNSCARRLSLIKTVAADLNVDINSTFFLSEVCMTFSKNSPNIELFLRTWDRYARKLQARGYGWGEGETIGVVAKYCNWQIHNIEPSLWLFKDVLTKDMSNENIKKFRFDRVMLNKLANKHSNKISTILKLAKTYPAIFLKRNIELLDNIR